MKIPFRLASDRLLPRLVPVYPIYVNERDFFLALEAGRLFTASKARGGKLEGGIPHFLYEGKARDPADSEQPRHGDKLCLFTRLMNTLKCKIKERKTIWEDANFLLERSRKNERGDGGAFT